MKIDTVCQILDTVSFVLITPEFMRDETLGKIRSVSRRIAKRWNLRFPDFMPGLIAIPLGLLCFGLAYMYAPNPGTLAQNAIKFVSGGFFWC
jgi:hypothetical protein